MAGRNKVSKIKFEEKILNDLNAILRKDIADPRLRLVSITKVKLSPDFSVAEVYWDTFDASKRGTIKKALTGVTGKLRAKLSQVLNVRHTPELQLFYDSQFEDEQKIQGLLNEEIKNNRFNPDASEE